MSRPAWTFIKKIVDITTDIKDFAFIFVIDDRLIWPLMPEFIKYAKNISYFRI
jgi:hypothetical protein